MESLSSCNQLLPMAMQQPAAAIAAAALQPAWPLHQLLLLL
jgi:hypothetical protein